MEAEAVVDALHRLYAGDACASRELEVFQASPQGYTVALKLLESMVAEVQFFAACTIYRIACCSDVKPHATEVDWLLRQASNCTHRPTARQLILAATKLVGPTGAPALTAHAIGLLTSESCWLTAVDMLMALTPEPLMEGVCARLGPWLGHGADELILQCALRYPQGIEHTPIGLALEEAVSNGIIHEIPNPGHMSSTFCARLAKAAGKAINGGHADAAASVLQDLQDLGIVLVDPANNLLRAPNVLTRGAAIELWSRILNRLAADECERVFEQFTRAFFVAAAWPDETDAEVHILRDSLWSLACEWQLATPSHLNLVDAALENLEQSLQGVGDWKQAEAALWILSKYAKKKTDNVARSMHACFVILRQLAEMPGLAPLVVSACALIEAIPSTNALPVLLDQRLVNLQVRGDDVRPAVAAAVCACCKKNIETLWSQGTAQTLVEEFQARALLGEEGLVVAAAQILAVRDVQPLVQQWANICACATPETLGAKAKIFFTTLVTPEVCLAYWRDCKYLLPHLPLEVQIEFIERIVGFASIKPDLVSSVVEIWCAVWALADGDKTLIEALGELVTLSARTSAVAAPAVESLASSLVHAHVWAPQALDAALGVIEITIAPAGCAWPLTKTLLSIYGFVLSQAGALATRQTVDAASLVGALVSWKDYDDEVGRTLFASLMSQAEAVRILLSTSKDRRLAQRIAGAIDLFQVS